MLLDDIKITKAIVSRFFNKFLDCLELDVALVGAGPSNLVCGSFLGENGIKAAIFESKLSPGGGMWGGGMMFNEIVVQDSALHLLDKFNIRYKKSQDGYYTSDSIESTSCLISSCIKAGTKIFNLINVEDVSFREEENIKKINGLVLNWSPVSNLKLHVDPLTIRSKFVVDGTGHPSEVCTMVSKKMDVKLNTRTGKVIGEMPMWADRGEDMTIKNSIEIFPGLFVAGMAANASNGSPRMGPVFGGMFLSGEKIAKQLIKRLA